MLMQQRLSLKLAQKPVLTQSLRQLVKLLALNKLDLKQEITQELESNPVLEAGVDPDDSANTDESAEEERWEGAAATAGEAVPAEPAQDAAAAPTAEINATEIGATKISTDNTTDIAAENGPTEGTSTAESAPDTVAESSDPFDEIDFNSFFNDYLDPGPHTPFAMEVIDRPSFETFLSQPTTLTDHLLWQLSLSLAGETVWDTVEAIIGNLDEDGYLTAALEEVAAASGASEKQAEEALYLVQDFDPLGVGARGVSECLMIQLRACGADEGVAGEIVEHHLALVEDGHNGDIASRLGRPQRHVDIALRVIRALDPRPGQHYAASKTRTVEPDLHFVKTQDGFRVVLNEDDLPDLRLNRQYRQLLQKGKATKEVRDYVKDRYHSAIQLLRNIEQRKHTIEGVCDAIVRRQGAFLANGIEHLRPMMIKDVAEEIGVHPSTVSRAVANKYAHTPHGVYELRFFFSEAVQGPAGNSIPLLLLKRRVKRMIEQENPVKPLTDEHISLMLREQGVEVTRRTVAKYREDLNIPSTHRRRKRP